MTQERTWADRILLSTLPAGHFERRLALVVALASAVMFLAAAPYAKVQLPRVDAFIPLYQSALVINDLITAALLFGQFGIVRSRALLVLACAYLFTASMIVCHTLSFPGLFAPAGLLGANVQSTAWLYMFWHAGFPLFLIAYALLKDRQRDRVPLRAMDLAVPSSIAAIFVVVYALAFLATAGGNALPAIMRGDHYTPAMVAVVSSVWGLSLLALLILWRRQRSVLDLWLMVVMCAWLFDIGLSAVLNHGRFDLGFYTGRIYGLLAATFVLMALLLENGTLYARLVEAHEGERRERELLEQKTVELLAVNKELDAFSYSVSHDLRAPVRAIDGFTRILEQDYGERLDAEGRRLLGVVSMSAQHMAQLIDDLLAFARLGRQPLRTRQVQLEELVNQTIAELKVIHGARRIDFAVGNLGTAEADPAILKQALANLLSNAIKFTRDKDPALVEVGCTGHTDHSDDARVYFVKDNGAGFDMRHSAKLFGVFQRFHRTEEYEGTGVGLAIVQRVIDRHGGRVWADSRPGLGATFYFTLGPGARRAALPAGSAA